MMRAVYSSFMNYNHYSWNPLGIIPSHDTRISSKRWQFHYTKQPFLVYLHANVLFCPQAFSVLSKIKDEDAKVKEFLLSFYREVETCYDDLDDNIQTLLKKKMGNVKEKTKSHQIKMKKEDYYLLVAGTFNCIIS